MLNDDGTYGEEESTMEITIRPPLWRTRWMILLYMLFIAASAWWWRRWFMHKYTRRSEAEALRRETEKLQWMTEMKQKMAAEALAAQPSHEEVVLNCQDDDLVAAVKHCCNRFSDSTLGRKAKLSFRSMVDKLPVSIDDDRMEEALHILLTNSVKFSPGNCQITVNLGRTSEGEAMLQVADNGIGIRDEYKEHAFDHVINGEGIGLDRVKDIIVAHGGTIRLDDNPGGGTIFFITLPTRKEIEVEEAVMMDDET
jgi:signal transduction histidine kinase